MHQAQAAGRRCVSARRREIGRHPAAGPDGRWPPTGPRGPTPAQRSRPRGHADAAQATSRRRIALIDRAEQDQGDPLQHARWTRTPRPMTRRPARVDAAIAAVRAAQVQLALSTCYPGRHRCGAQRSVPENPLTRRRGDHHRRGTAQSRRWPLHIGVPSTPIGRSKRPKPTQRDRHPGRVTSDGSRRTRLVRVRRGQTLMALSMRWGRTWVARPWLPIPKIRAGSAAPVTVQGYAGHTSAASCVGAASTASGGPLRADLQQIQNRARTRTRVASLTATAGVAIETGSVPPIAASNRPEAVRPLRRHPRVPMPPHRHCRPSPRIRELRPAC